MRAHGDAGFSPRRCASAGPCAPCNAAAVEEKTQPPEMTERGRAVGSMPMPPPLGRTRRAHRTSRPNPPGKWRCFMHVCASRGRLPQPTAAGEGQAVQLPATAARIQSPSRGEGRRRRRGWRERRRCGVGAEPLLRRCSGGSPPPREEYKGTGE